MDKKQLIQVKNLTGNHVYYNIPEDNVHRKFGPFEEKQITYDEIQKLYYQNGGDVLIKDYLQIKNKEVALEFGVEEESFENEYSWDKEKVDNVLLNEHIDVLHDALDFAPEGIVDLIISEAINLRIMDINKRNLIQECTGKNINNMIQNQIELEKQIGEVKQEEPKRRRVATQEEEQPQQRRAAQSAEGESLFN